MALVKKLALLLGGEIYLESEVQVGSTFTLRIPWILPELNEEYGGLIDKKEEERAFLGNTFSTIGEASKIEARDEKSNGVLVIDDHPDIATLLREMLQPEGFRVEAAYHADEALEYLKTFRPAIILLDVMLPRVDGWELLSQIKKQASLRKIPVVVCSIVENRNLAFALGAADYVVKPFTKEKILESFHRLIPSRRPRLVRPPTPPRVRFSS